MILTAAYLHDIGIKESERKHQSAIAWYQAAERSPAAKEMLTRLGAREE